MPYQIVGANIDTWLMNVKGKFADELADELEHLKAASQEADEDMRTRLTFVEETLFIRAHGSGRQWRWILHCPSLHLDIGRGRLNHIIGKARLSAAFLWEHELGDALHLLSSFLVGLWTKRRNGRNDATSNRHMASAHDSWQIASNHQHRGALTDVCVDG